MQCNICGTLLPPEAITCPKCGAPISSSSGYDAIPYVESQTYREHPVPAPAPTLSSITIQEAPSTTFGDSITTYPPQRVQQSRRLPIWMTVLLILLSLLLIVEGIGSLVYASTINPADLHTQATAVTKNFLTAQAQSTLQAGIRATATANAMTPEQVYQQATSGTPIINDPLKDDSGNVWYHHNGTTYKDLCNFHAGAYHIQVGKGSGLCLGYKSVSNNLVFQTQIKIIQGNVGGLIFRFNENNNARTFYVFGITINSGYVLDLITSQQTKTLKSGIDLAIKPGLNQANLLTVIANNSHIYLYVNGQSIDSITDTTYTSGEIGFIASSSTEPVDIAFNNVKVWEL